MAKPTKKQIKDLIKEAETEEAENFMFGYVDLDLIAEKEGRTMSLLLELYSKEFIDDIKINPTFYVEKGDLGKELARLTNNNWENVGWNHNIERGFKTFIFDKKTFAELLEEQSEFEF